MAPGRQKIFRRSARPCCRISTGETLPSECTTPISARNIPSIRSGWCFPRSQGHVLGGSVAGDADVTQWLNSANREPAAKTKRSPNRQSGTLRLRFKDLSAAEIAAALSTPSRPFHNQTRWTGQRKRGCPLEGLHPQHGSPVRRRCGAAGEPRRRNCRSPAHAQGSTVSARASWNLTELNAATRATQVHASGTLSSSAALKLSVTTTDLGEWQPVFSAAGYAGPDPGNAERTRLVQRHGHGKAFRRSPSRAICSRRTSRP